MLTDEQKRERIGLVTSSVAAGALGLHPRITPIGAWCRVLGDEPAAEAAPSKAIERGNLLEAVVLDYPCRKLGLTFAPAPFKRHPNGWAGDSADGLYMDADLNTYAAEAKTVSGSAADSYGREWTDQVPDSTLVQAHWHMIHHPDARATWVPVLVGGYLEFEFRLYRVDRDAELEGLLLQDLEKWHRDYVQTRRPPPAIAGDTEYLKAHHPRATAGYLPDNDQIAELVARKLEAAAAREQAEQAEQAAANELRQLIGDHEGVKGADYTVYWRNRADTFKTNWEAICEELNVPEALKSKYTQAVPGPRVLRIYPKRGES